jgi:hypothetical protein
MKTRNGFVSNSSSSSFIVAFPRKPQAVGELSHMLFGDAPLSTITNHRWADSNDEGASLAELCDVVWSDISSRNDSATLEQLAEEMTSFYYWDNGYNCYHLDENLNPIQSHGWTFAKDSPFFGSDKKLTDELMNLEIDEAEMNKRHQEETRQFENGLLRKKGVDVVADRDSQKTYEARQDLQEALYKKPTKAYKALRDRHQTESNEVWKKMSELRGQCALADAKAMLAKYPDSFIAMFSYGDNHGDTCGRLGTILEQGNVWDKVPHIKVCHH